MGELKGQVVRSQCHSQQFYIYFYHYLEMTKMVSLSPFLLPLCVHLSPHHCEARYLYRGVRYASCISGTTVDDLHDLVLLVGYDLMFPMTTVSLPSLTCLVLTPALFPSQMRLELGYQSTMACFRLNTPVDPPSCG